MQTLYNYLKENPVVYVTRDLERALAMPRDTDGYFIVDSNFVCAQKPQDTYKILENPSAVEFISNHDGASILVFKNTPQIERICDQNGWNLLNPRADLVNTIEDKISQVRWLGEAAELLPSHEIRLGKELKWEGKQFILQFNKSHTGEGTFLIKNEDQLKEVATKFPEREVRVTDYVAGTIFTNNNVVTADKILIGNISYQITGDPGLTDNPLATVGNDWGKAQELLSGKQQKEYRQIARQVGQLMKESGWKGLFGIDVVLENESGKMYLLEINARQPASTTTESQLQRLERQAGASGITIFEAHLASLLDLPVKENLIEIKEGRKEINRKM